MSKQDQQRIYKMFNQNSIAYNPGLAEVLGSVEAAIFIGQLLYWNGLGKYKDWTYKTMKDMQAETGLSRSQQERVIKECKSLELIQVKLKGIPATRHFQLNLKKLADFIASRLRETSKLNSMIASNPAAENPQAIPENTQNNTSKGYKSFLQKREELRKKIGGKNG